jgi:gluconate 2-dehydrogenase gamma chain
MLATGTALQLTPRSRLLALLREARTRAVSGAGPRTLSAHQFATVKTMAEMTIPLTDTPGATDVGVAEFIDLILTEWCESKERSMFVAGVDDVDQRAQALFSKPFVESSTTEQAEIFDWLGKSMREELSRQHAHEAESQPEPDQSFYLMFRRLTLTAYYTSEDGATKEQGFVIIPERHEGCAFEQSIGPNQGSK